mgnify:CR=1 FL=1
MKQDNTKKQCCKDGCEIHYESDAVSEKKEKCTKGKCKNKKGGK